MCACDRTIWQIIYHTNTSIIYDAPLPLHFRLKQKQKTKKKQKIQQKNKQQKKQENIKLERKF